MKIKNTTFALLLITLISCGSYKNGELIGVKDIPWNDPAPYGMVLIQHNSFELGKAKEDTVFGFNSLSKDVSVESFWMDQTEITNGQYKEFIKWVCDSIIREKLADPAYGGNDDFKITEDKNGEPVTPHLNWRIPIPSRKRATEEELMALDYFKEKDPVLGGYKTNTEKIVYAYNWFDYTAEAKNKENLKNKNKDIIISKDTAYIADNGEIINKKIKRPLTSRWDFLNTRIIAIYPDTTCWINDFENSNNKLYAKEYFTHKCYNAYPVVGVNYKQALAFCNWRTEMLRNSPSMINRPKPTEYRLPTEAEWELAARNKEIDSPYPWKGNDVKSPKGCYYANFKPGKGNYTDDGSLITCKVKSYPENAYGLYDMAGNVAEWTSTDYVQNSFENENEINPDIKASNNKSQPVLRKIVRGGSWKDAARFIKVSSRTFENEDKSRSYIGFRCVRSCIGNKK